MLNILLSAADFAGQQLTVLKDDVLVENYIFTSYTDEDGQWITVKDNGDVIDLTVWTSGMVAGMFWYQYEATGQNIWRTYAEDMQEGLEGVELLDDNDLGFQTLNSFGLGYRLVGTSSFKDITLSGAQSLYDYRYVSNIPAFWSWANPKSEPQWERAVNVDMIMNMEIMLWAAVNDGDAEYSDAAENHADTTWADLVRDDYSTFHVADYNKSTGELVDKGTYQGWQDDSTWSRGQAWAIYGFIMVHRYLQKPRFLDYGINTLSYFVDNLPDDNVPYADFDAPVDSDNPKDSSATAIVTSALFELFEQTGEPSYLEKGQEFLSSLLLSPNYFDSSATDGWQAILRNSAAAWGDAAVGSVTADYFLLESMVRYQTMSPSIILRNETEVSITDTQPSVEFSGTALDNDVDLSGLSADSPVITWLGVTLTDAGYVPESLTLGSGSASVTVDIEQPDGGWNTGSNGVSFSVAAGTFSGLSTVDSVTLSFGQVSAVTTAATVDYLVLGHQLNTSLETGDAGVVEAFDSASVTTCSNGVQGIDGNGIVCCPMECNQCGGSGCTHAGRAAGLGAESCCGSGVKASGRYCDDTDEAPCIIGSSPE
ncbi:Unsaturated glucuronyl hydrolase, family GH88 [Ectocarpus siliculosus]|uniref:Unsaturated glucuronyl hydrolase, family GH88 n=1 Tax=Ectocarpus siliculosus TaxID=2880 RepID=D7FUJ9_ECTSI|nr:Unsaturated glucuronyl hydrolase, family GH88 [Ectocarpus siliculosus]|eukprot:CBJ31655.1 Unsaturated glucuronyl hydrolase, family GH88 [Ectocarpus siliculosus]